MRDINLKIEEGKFTSIVGPNGSGKSTLMKMILNRKLHYSGDILIGGENIKSISMDQFSKMISYVPQNFSIEMDFSVKEYIELGRFPYRTSKFGFSKEDKKAVDFAMKKCELEEKRDKSVLKLSGGEFQRVVIARVIAQETDIIFLDEPTSNLDTHHKLSLLKTLKKLNKEYGKTVVTILHDLNMAYKFSDKIVLMENGKIIENSSADKIIDNKNLKAVYKNEIKIIKDENGNKHIVAKFD